MPRVLIGAMVIACCLAHIGAQQADSKKSFEQLRAEDIARRKAALEEELRRAAEHRASQEKILSRIRADSLCLAGTDTACSTLTRLYQEFRRGRSRGPRQVWYQGGGTDIGIARLTRGHAQAALIRRVLKPKEQAQLAAAFPAGTPQPKEVAFSKSALVFLVHATNRVPSLTCRQARGIYLKEIAEWQQVGAGVASQIRPLGTTYPALSWGIFTRQVMNNRSPKRGPKRLRGERLTPEEHKKRLEEWKKSNPYAFRICDSDAKVAREVAKDRSAIGYCILPSTDVKLKGVRAVPIVPPDGGEAVAPTRENLLLDKRPAPDRGERANPLGPSHGRLQGRQGGEDWRGGRFGGAGADEGAGARVRQGEGGGADELCAHRLGGVGGAVLRSGLGAAGNG